MHPNALLDLAAELLRAVLQFDAAGRRRGVGLLSPAPRARRARAPHAGRDRLRRAAPAPAVPAPGARRQRRDGAAPGAPGLAGRAALPRAAHDDARTAMAGAWQAVDRVALPGQAAPQPARLAGRRAAARNSATTQFWPLVAGLDAAGAAGSARQHAEGQARGGAGDAARAGIDAVPTPYSPWGLRVAGQAGAAQAAGCSRAAMFEVQDEGSQLLALLIDAKRGEMVVDFCAGAGGKTLALGAAMRNTGRLYAFDVSGHRLAALKPRAGAQRPVQRAPGADRARARRAHQAPGRQDRPRAGRRAVLGPGHAAPQPGPEVAPDARPPWRNCDSKQQAILAGAARCSNPAAASSTPPAACCEPKTKALPGRSGKPIRNSRRSPSSRRLRRLASRAAAELVAGRLPAAVAAPAWTPTASSRRSGNVRAESAGESSSCASSDSG